MNNQKQIWRGIKTRLLKIHTSAHCGCHYIPGAAGFTLERKRVDDSVNTGNFIELLKLISQYDVPLQLLEKIIAQFSPFL